MQHLRRRSAFLLLSLVVAASACGKREDPGSASSPKDVTQAPDHTPSSAGDPAKTLQNLEDAENGKSAGPCELVDRERKRDLIRAVYARQGEIDRFVETREAPENGRMEKIGPLNLIVSAQDPIDGEWEEKEKSWAKAFAEYDRIRNTNDLEDWMYLYSGVIDLVDEDYRRAHTQVSYLFKHDSLPLIQAASQAVTQCLHESTCQSLKLPEASEALLRPDPLYARKLDRLAAGRDDETAMDLIRDLNSDMKRFRHAIAEGVRQTAPGKYAVQMYTEQFAGFESRLEEIFTGPWNADGHSISIEWLPKLDLTKIVTVKYAAQANGRSYVDRSQGEMVLYSGAMSYDLPHEFGHVLGLRDEYYARFEPSRCAYVTERDRSNIMSVHWKGKVKESHWEHFAKSYPLNP